MLKIIYYPCGYNISGNIYAINFHSKVEQLIYILLYILTVGHIKNVFNFYFFYCRPPPKFIRRPAPVEPPTVPVSANTAASIAAASAVSALHKKETESPLNSLERNIKPSEILRQKSSDSLDVKLAPMYRRTTPDLSKQSDLADEFGRKFINKTESLEKNRRPDASKYML